jgi:hypothetical protein
LTSHHVCSRNELPHLHVRELFGLEQSLKSQYPKGIVLNVVTSGLTGTSVCDVYSQAAFKDGKLHAVGFVQKTALAAFKCELQPIESGTQVNLTAMKVNENKVSFTVLQGQCAVSDCSKVMPGGVSAQVDFEFPKGFLATATFAQLQDTIGHVFSTSGSPNAPEQEAQVAQAAIALAAVAPMKLPSTYVSAQVPTDKLQLNPDNSFSFQEGGQSYHGTFVLSGNTIELSISENGAKTTLARQGDNLVDSSALTWNLQQQSTGATPSGVTFQGTAGNTCPPPGTEILFAKVMNEAFAANYVGCDITSKVEFGAAGGFPSFRWGSLEEQLEAKTPFRVAVPNRQPGHSGGNPFEIPPHVFLAKDKSEEIFSFKEGDLLIIRGAPLVGDTLTTANRMALKKVMSEAQLKQIAQPLIVFVATEARAAVTLQEQPAGTTSSGVALQNDDVIKMVKAGFGDKIITAKISRSKCQFDTSTDALILLKKNGVSTAVLEAMVGAGQ